MQQKNNNKDIKKILINLGYNIRKLRNEKRKTQIEISNEMQVDSRVYQRIESQNPPDIRFSTLYKILKYHNITLEKLMKE